MVDIKKGSSNKSQLQPPPTLQQALARKGKKSAQEMEVITEAVRDRVMQGMTDIAIREDLSLPAKDYNFIVKRVLDEEIIKVNKQTTLQVYAEYILEQKGIIKECEKIIAESKGQELGGNGNGNKKKRHWRGGTVVATLKLKSDIIDKVLSKGQDLGLISKSAKRIEFIGRIDVRNMDEVALRQLILTELGKMGRWQSGGITEQDFVEAEYEELGERASPEELQALPGEREADEMELDYLTAKAGEGDIEDTEVAGEEPDDEVSEEELVSLREDIDDNDDDTDDISGDIPGVDMREASELVMGLKGKSGNGRGVGKDRGNIGVRVRGKDTRPVRQKVIRDESRV